MGQYATDAAFWDEKYLRGQTGWDIGTVSPPLKQYIDQLTWPDAAILIPGCGNAYEARYLVEKGFRNITLIDISHIAVENLKRHFEKDYGYQPTIIQGDFFNLEGQYDLVLEQTFFCALDPFLRESYVKQMHALLKPSGRIAGLLFDRDFEGGPPFGGDAETYRQLFSPFFNIRTLEPCYNSIPQRAGAEVFVIFEKP
jgi:SAM-dependent methyltransferase